MFIRWPTAGRRCFIFMPANPELHAMRTQPEQVNWFATLSHPDFLQDPYPTLVS